MAQRNLPDSEEPGVDQRRLDPEESRLQSQARKETFDRRYRLLELRERREDRALKQREIELGLGRGIRFTSSQAAVAGAALALLSAVIGGVIQSYTTQSVKSEENASMIAIERLKADASIALERQKQEFAERLERAEFETTLILKAIEASKREDQIRNLKFFLNAGFITDPVGKIGGMDEDAFPSLPPPDAKQVLSPSELMVSAKDAVGKIEVAGPPAEGDSAGQIIRNRGTAFFVSSDGYALTAAYLFENLSNRSDDRTIRITFSSRSPSLNAHLIAKDDQYGVALVRSSVSANDFVSVKISPRATKTGERVYLIGYIGNFDSARLDVGNISTLSGHSGRMEISAATESGYGGAPVFDEYGEVIGIVLGRRFDATGGSGATVVIPINYAAQMLAAVGSIRQ